jgi:hypothetical protein
VQIKTTNEIQRARGTHGLSSAEGRTSQDSERKLVSEGYSLSVGPRKGLVSERKPVSEGHSRPDEHKRMDSSGRQ